MTRINITGVIIPNDYKKAYNWLGIESTCPKDVERALERANGEEVEIFINSGGGSVFDGAEIYSRIAAYKGETKIYIIGCAASAASVIACAAKCFISPAAMMMIHNVSCVAEGNCNDMVHMSKVLKEADRAIATAYCKKTNLPEAEILNLMGKETWLSAARAVEFGFADQIMELTPSPPLLAADCFPGLISQKTVKTIENMMDGSALLTWSTSETYDSGSTPPEALARGSARIVNAQIQILKLRRSKYEF